MKAASGRGRWAGGIGLLVGAGVLGSGCVRLQTDPIRIEPITIEVTVNHRIQDELDNYFGEIDRMSETTEAEAVSEGEPLENEEKQGE